MCMCVCVCFAFIGLYHLYEMQSSFIKFSLVVARLKPLIQLFFFTIIAGSVWFQILSPNLLLNNSVLYFSQWCLCLRSMENKKGRL